MQFKENKHPKLLSNSLKKSKKKILFSVIIPHYNDTQYLYNCLSSILKQSFPPHEIIVIDDGSSTSEKVKLKKLVKKSKKIKVFYNKQNFGVSYSVNKGIKKASGNFIACFSANDFYIGNYFQKAYKLLNKHPNCGLICSNPGLYTQKGALIKYSLSWNIKEKCFLSPLQFAAAYARDWRRAGGGTSIIWNKRLLQKIGGFSRDLCWMCDWYAYVFLGLRFGVCYVPETFGVWRENKSSYAAKANKDKFKQKKICKLILEKINQKFTDQEKKLFYDNGFLSVVPYSFDAIIRNKRLESITKQFVSRKIKLFLFTKIKSIISNSILDFCRHKYG